MVSADSSGEEDSDEDDENNRSQQSFSEATVEQVNIVYILKTILTNIYNDLVS